MSKLSVIILTKNEEPRIADCIDSISWADEILLIDDNSTDRTCDIAKMMGAKVYVQQFTDFSERRMFGQSKAKEKWILYIDADERVTKELRDEIIDATRKKFSFAAYKLQRKNFYLGHNEWPYIEKLERLFQKDALKKWHGILHETPVVDGEIGELDGFLLHYTHRNIKEMLQKTITWSQHEAQLRFNANHPHMTWWRFPRVMISAFFNSYIRQKGWKVGTVGLIESIYQAFSMFITYARLWEMQLSTQKESVFRNE